MIDIVLPPWLAVVLAVILLIILVVLVIADMVLTGGATTIMFAIGIVGVILFWLLLSVLGITPSDIQLVSISIAP